MPLLAFCGALAVRRRSFWPALIAAALLMGLKEDQILFVLWFGAACALVVGPAHRRSRCCVLAVANGVGFCRVRTSRWAHGRTIRRTGLRSYDVSGKLTMIVFLLVPFAFAPLAIGRWLLLGIPLLAEIVFMRPWNYEPSRIGSHYTAPLLAATAAAAAFGVAAQSPLRARDGAVRDRRDACSLTIRCCAWGAGPTSSIGTPTRARSPCEMAKRR